MLYDIRCGEDVGPHLQKNRMGRTDTAVFKSAGREMRWKSKNSVGPRKADSLASCCVWTHEQRNSDSGGNTDSERLDRLGYAQEGLHGLVEVDEKERVLLITMVNTRSRT